MTFSQLQNLSVDQDKKTQPHIFVFLLHLPLYFRCLCSVNYNVSIFQMKSSNNRKPIPLHRPPEAKRTILSAFEPDLNQDIQSYLSLQREKLRNLEKATAKKIISTAERSLMNFMRSKAKINCFKQKNALIQPYATIPSRNSSPKNIFNPKKLQAQLQHEQRSIRHPATESSPLIEYSMRQVGEGRSKGAGINAGKTVLGVESRNSEVYCGYSNKKKSNKMIYY